MNEETAFWKQVTIGAANLNLDILVEKDGKLSLRHKKSWGDPERPTDAKVETFRNFLSRNRAMILKANGVEAKADPVAEDARRLREWLEARKAAPDCLLRDADGRQWSFAETRDRLLRTYKETADWVLATYRFQKVVSNHIGWSERTTEMPEAWK